jgi:dihydrofolate reductase
LNTLSLITAFDLNYLIGNDNHLPWRISEDLQHFRSITMGHTVVMGKNTWISLGKPLEGRTNIILTHDTDYQIPGCLVYNSVEQVINGTQDDEVFIIGGSEVFKQFLPFANKMYITRIQHSFTGNKYFPPVNWQDWVMDSYELMKTQSGIDLAFEIWLKKP